MVTNVITNGYICNHMDYIRILHTYSYDYILLYVFLRIYSLTICIFLTREDPYYSTICTCGGMGVPKCAMNYTLKIAHQKF